MFLSDHGRTAKYNDSLGNVRGSTIEHLGLAENKGQSQKSFFFFFFLDKTLLSLSLKCGK